MDCWRGASRRRRREPDVTAADNSVAPRARGFPQQSAQLTHLILMTTSQLRGHASSLHAEENVARKPHTFTVHSSNSAKEINSNGTSQAANTGTDTEATAAARNRKQRGAHH